MTFIHIKWCYFFHRMYLDRLKISRWSICCNRVRAPGTPGRPLRRRSSDECRSGFPRRATWRRWCDPPTRRGQEDEAKQSGNETKLKDVNENTCDTINGSHPLMKYVLL